MMKFRMDGSEILKRGGYSPVTNNEEINRVLGWTEQCP
jgi:hypothetical protein